MEEAARAVQATVAGKTGGGETPEEEPPQGAGELAPQDAARVEALFAEAQRDRSKALALKAELDRLGASARYEDRFLDLFKRAE
jgi:hypothetical protein